MAEGNRPDALEWLAYAEADLGVADHLFRTYQPKPLQIICFHCQQAAEKAIKAVIVFLGSEGGLPRKYDLFLLLNQIKNMVVIDGKFYDYADMLAPYGVAMRYPNELPLEERHAEMAISMAMEITEWAKQIIVVENAGDH